METTVRSTPLDHKHNDRN